MLSQNIRSLVLPQRLAAITSLELVCDLFGDINFEEYHQAPAGLWKNYSYIMEKIPTNFPSLSSLHFSVLTTIYTPDFPVVAMTDEVQLFRPADNLVRHYGSKLRTCQIAPTRKLFTVLLQKAETAGARIEKGGIGAGFWQQFWRPVTVDDNDSTPNNLGYWVRQGKDDTPVW